MKIPSIKSLERWYKVGNHKELTRWLPHLLQNKNPFIKFLKESNLLTIGGIIEELPPFTLGADPEFILTNKEGKVSLFSSAWTNDYFGISEAEIGADYGLLEFRPPPVDSPEKLVEAIEKIHEEFRRTYTVNQSDPLFILESEAKEFNHRKKRILEVIEEGKDISYGYGRGKDVGVWNSSCSSEIIVDNEIETTFSAYDKPNFPQYNEKMFTAGGHIHVGGTFIKMLSFKQIQQLIKKFDEEVLPLTIKAETKDGELRRTVYGEKGEFRIKNYGIEYRSPSNAIFWEKNLSVLLKVLQKVEKISKNLAF